jgi:hypothetical protein
VMMKDWSPCVATRDPESAYFTADHLKQWRVFVSALYVEFLKHSHYQKCLSLYIQSKWHYECCLYASSEALSLRMLCIF